MAREGIQIPLHFVVAGVCGQCGMKKTYHQSVRPDMLSREDSNRSDVMAHMQQNHPRQRSGHEFFIEVISNNNLIEIFGEEATPRYYHPACGQLIATLKDVLHHTCQHRRNGTAMWDALVTANDTMQNAKALAK